MCREKTPTKEQEKDELERQEEPQKDVAHGSQHCSSSMFCKNSERNRWNKEGVRWNQGQDWAVPRNLEELCSSLRRKPRGWRFLPKHVRAARGQVSKPT